MFRTLTIIAVSGILVAAACFAGAFALGGRDLARHGVFTRGPFFWSFRSENFGGPTVTREIPWSASNELLLFHSGDMHFTQGPRRKLTVTGPAGIVNRLTMRNGMISPETGPFGVGAPISVEATAPDIDTFKTFGFWRIYIDGFDQDRLAIEINGDGEVTSRGKARDVAVTIRGAGDVDAGAVAAKQAHVRIMGSGDAKIAPTDTADIDIAGSGDVTLLTDPPHINTDIKGSGNIIHGGDAAPEKSPPKSTAPSEDEKPI